MMTNYQPRLIVAELEDSIRRSWRLMQAQRRKAIDSTTPPWMFRLARMRAQHYEEILRSLLAVRKAGRVK